MTVDDFCCALHPNEVFGQIACPDGRDGCDVYHFGCRKCEREQEMRAFGALGGVVPPAAERFVDKARFEQCVQVVADLSALVVEITRHNAKLTVEIDTLRRRLDMIEYRNLLAGGSEVIQ